MIILQWWNPTADKWADVHRTDDVGDMIVYLMTKPREYFGTGSYRILDVAPVSNLRHVIAQFVL